MSAAEFQRTYGNGGTAEPASTAGETSAKPQIRLPRKAQPNKTEAAWIARCEVLHRATPGTRVLYESLTLRLPSGARYTPDVVVMHGPAIVEIWEVKGAHVHNARSILAFKEAVAAYPFWQFGFAQCVKGDWRTKTAAAPQS
jgi:hypothetical protein